MADNLKIPEKLSDLLYKDILGVTAEEEKVELESLLAEYKIKGIDRSDLIARLQEKDIFEGRKAYQQFLGLKVVKHRLGWWISSVAAVAVLIVSGWWFIREPEQQDKTEIVVSEIIHPGQSYAIVTLADGRRVPLEKETRELEECDGTILRSESGELTYKANQDIKNVEIMYNTLTVPKGGEYRLELADGTKVWLNAETELKFPVNFSGSTRDVYIKGEAYFQVARDEKHVFQVHTSMGAVKVLGTSFNIRDYADEQRMVATLETGKVVYISDGLKKEVVLVPGEQVREDKYKGIRVKEVDVAQYVGWHEGKYVFENVSLEEIMQTLGRWYDIEVVYLDSAVKKLHFSGDLERYGSICVFLDFIETGGDVKFKTEGKTIIINKK